jgi:toxin CptA
LQWRGPLAFLRWRDSDGRMHRLAWWPDVLPVAARRELRLAALDGAGAVPAASMAP